MNTACCCHKSVCAAVGSNPFSKAACRCVRKLRCACTTVQRAAVSSAGCSNVWQRVRCVACTACSRGVVIRMSTGYRHTLKLVVMGHGRSALLVSHKLVCSHIAVTTDAKRRLWSCHYRFSNKGWERFCAACVAVFTSFGCAV